MIQKRFYVKTKLQLQIKYTVTRKFKTTTTLLQRNNNSIMGINDFSKYSSVTFKKETP